MVSKKFETQQEAHTWMRKPVMLLRRSLNFPAAVPVYLRRRRLLRGQPIVLTVYDLKPLPSTGTELEDAGGTTAPELVDDGGTGTAELVEPPTRLSAGYLRQMRLKMHTQYWNRAVR